MEWTKLFAVIIGAAILLLASALVIQSLNVGQQHQQCFTVTDVSVDQWCNLTYIPDPSHIIVEQYDGVSWSTIPSYGYNLTDPDTIIVDQGVLI